MINIDYRKCCEEFDQKRKKEEQARARKEEEYRRNTFLCNECGEVKDRSKQARTEGGQRMPYCCVCLPK